MECRIIKKTRGFIPVIVLIVSICMMTSCYYDNEEELYPGANTGCDTTTVTYSGTIAPLMDQYCNACHKAGSNNIVTDNYTTLRIIAEDGRLWGVVNHEGSYSPMPKNAGKLNSCNLARIRVWLNDGSPNN